MIAALSGCGFRRISRYKSISSLHASYKMRFDTPVSNVFATYPLKPDANHNMAITSALDIRQCDGNPDKIFVSVSSAGRHSAALPELQNRDFDSIKIVSPITGAILIAPAELDMYNLLKDNKPPSPDCLKTFTNNQAVWNKASQ